MITFKIHNIYNNLCIYLYGLPFDTLLENVEHVYLDDDDVIVDFEDMHSIPLHLAGIARSVMNEYRAR